MTSKPKSRCLVRLGLHGFNQRSGITGLWVLGLQDSGLSGRVTRKLVLYRIDEHRSEKEEQDRLIMGSSCQDIRIVATHGLSSMQLAF